MRQVKRRGVLAVLVILAGSMAVRAQRAPGTPIGVPSAPPSIRTAPAIAGISLVPADPNQTVTIREKIGRLRLEAAANPTDLCFPDPATPTAPAAERCVPWELVRVAFGGYVKGGRAPSQILIDLQAQLAQTLEQLRECQGQLGPLAAKQHLAGLQAQQSALDQAFGAACAITGRVWDGPTQACAAAPADPPKAAAPIKK